MGNCIKTNPCSGARQQSHNLHTEQVQQELIPNVTNTQIDQNVTPINNNSISSLENSTNVSTNNNIINLPQVQSNSEQGSLNNLASIINNSISFHSTNSNSVLIGNTLTNTTASYYNNNSISGYVPPTGKNKKLKKDCIKNFKFDKRITEKQLNAKRDEFWDTAPAYEGKIEIWTALKAAVEAYEQKNYQLAQAIIDSANIILPKGFLNDCYDELGNRYQIPIYVLAKPSNLRKSVNSGSTEEKDSTCLEEDSKDSKSPKNLKKSSKKTKKKNKLDFEIEDEDDDEDEESDVFNIDSLNVQKTKSNFFRNKLRFSKVKNASNLIGSTSFSFETKKSKAKQDELADLALQRSNSIDELFQIKIRISNQYNENDLKVKVSLNQTVGQLKSQVSDLFHIEPYQQRIFFSGKLMKDKQKLKDHKLKRNVVVQVIVRDIKNENVEEKIAPLVDNLKIEIKPESSTVKEEAL